MSSSPSPAPRSEAEQIVLLTKELEWSRLKIQVLEERLGLELIRKYGPKSENLSDHQLHLLDLEPGVSSEEVEVESGRDPLPPTPPSATANVYLSREVLSAQIAIHPTPLLEEEIEAEDIGEAERSPVA